MESYSKLAQGQPYDYGRYSWMISDISGKLLCIYIKFNGYLTEIEYYGCSVKLFLLFGPFSNSTF